MQIRPKEVASVVTSGMQLAADEVAQGTYSALLVASFD